MRRSGLVVLVLVLAIGLLPGAGGAQPAQGEPASDTVSVGQTGSATPNIDVTVELSQATFADGAATRVLIGRDDVFADSLSSGVAQDAGPLLLVPTAGPLPAQVVGEINRVGASSAVILGGLAAVSETVEQELSQMGLSVERRSGPSRIETAIAVATAHAPDATTAILARAGGVEGNPTSGFADALAAGGWSTTTGWPVLLTQTDVLTPSTRDYLAGSSIRTVNVVGGTAAVGAAVEQSLTDMGITVQRVSGPDRAATAIEIAKARDAATAASVDEVIVVDGFSADAWAAGFGAAARSALRSAPIVLGNVDSLPPATESWLAPGPEVLTCAVTPGVCEQARLLSGFSPALQVEIPPGTVTFTVADATTSLVWSAQFDGSAPGLAFRCGDVRCGEPDWTASGQRLYVETRTADGSDINGVFAFTGNVLERNPSVGQGDVRLTGLNADDRPAAAFLPDAATINDPNFGVIATRFDPGSGMYNTGLLGDAQFPSYQVTNDHPLSGGNDIAVLVLESNADLTVYIDDGSGVASHLQRRPGSQVLGAAWAGDGSGDTAVTDVIAGSGLLRIAAYPDGPVVSVDGLDVNSAPYWLPGNESLVVLADTDAGVSLIGIDAASGAQTMLVEDAGDAAGGRITSDGSGTLVAWRASGEIRVLNTADGSVAVIQPPTGFELTGGPSIRP